MAGRVGCSDLAGAFLDYCIDLLVVSLRKVLKEEGFKKLLSMRWVAV